MESNPITIINEKIAKSLTRWQERSKVDFKLVGSKDNVLKFSTDQGRFNVTYPPKYPKSKDGSTFLVEELDDCLWMGDINTFIFDVTPKFGALMKEIEKRYQRGQLKDDDIDLDFDFNVEELEEEDELLSESDIEEMRLRQRIEGKASTVKSPLSVDDSSSSSKVPMLFGGRAASSILTTEFMDLWKEKKKSPNMRLELVDDNIYHWRVRMRNFSNDEIRKSLETLQETQGFDYMELDIQFHDRLYPMYPPFVRVVRPRLGNSLMNRITNLKMLQLEYWTSTRGVKYVLNKIYEILNKHGVVDVEKTLGLDIKQVYHPMEELLTKLAALCELKEEYESLDDTEYKQVYVKKTSATTKKTSSGSNRSVGWAPGTGYGYGDKSDWDPDKYLELQKEKDVQILAVLQRLVEIMQTSGSEEMPLIYQIVENSFLNLFLRTHLQGTTLVDMSGHKDLYRMIFVLLQNFMTADGVFLLADNKTPDLYTILGEIRQEATTMMKFIKDDKNDGGDGDVDLETIQMINMIHEVVTPTYHEFVNQRKKKEEEIQAKRMEMLKTADKNWADKMEKAKVTEDPEKVEYIKQMEKYRYQDQCQFVKNGFNYKDKTITAKGRRALAKEYGSLGRTVPIHFDSSIFVRVDEQMNYIRAVITGPDQTPYDSGIFIFDIACNERYPDGPPEMHYVNCSGVRQNPNLYDQGKVCLSLLGTWHGGKGESWNKQSTLNQLFVSVQSQILIGSPFWNEPGHENCPEEQNVRYRQYCQYYTMRYCMVEILKDVNKGKYPELKDIVLNHFRLKKRYILELCKGWCDKATDLNSGPQQSHKLSKSDMTKYYDELKKEINTL